MISHFRLIVMMHIFIMLMVPTSQNLFAEEGYSLKDLYRIALERSEKIKISGEDLYVSEKGRDKALSSLLPKFSAFWDYTRYSKEKTAVFGSTLLAIQPEYSASWGLRLDQTMSTGGRELTAFKISKENIEKSKFELYAVREGYLLSVASAYYDVLKAQKALEIARVNSERLTKHRDAAATRLKVGDVTKTDLLRAEAELSGSQADLVKADNNLKLAKAILARIVGLDGDYDVKEPDIKGKPAEEYVLSSLKGKALLEHAQLQSQDLHNRISEAQVRYAQGAYWPTLSVEGVYSRMEEEPTLPFFLRESIYGMLSVTFPFFEGGLRRAEVGEAKARLRQSELIYEDLKKTIMIEVESAFLEFQTQKGVLKSLEDEVTFARDNFNSVSRQYEFGLANSIEVIDANTLLLTSERQLEDAKYDYQLSVLKLERATGTLLKTIASQQSSVISQNIKEK